MQPSTFWHKQCKSYMFTNKYSRMHRKSIFGKLFIMLRNNGNFWTKFSSFTFYLLLRVHVWKFNLMHRWYLMRTILTKSDILPAYIYIYKLYIDQKTIIFGLQIHLIVMFGIILFATYFVSSKNWIYFNPVYIHIIFR